MKRIAAVVVLGVCALAGPRMARADRAIEVGGFLGAHIFSEDNELGVYEEPGAPSPKNGLIGGVRVAAALFGRLDLEAELGLTPTTVRDADADVMVIALRGHALFHFAAPRAKLRPFVLVGAGSQTSSSSNRTIIDLDTDFAAHAGAGVKYRLGKRWGVRVDGRVVLPPSSDSSSVVTDFEGLLGIYGRFGDEGPAAPAVVAPPPDPDADGIVGDADKCPEQAETAHSVEDDDGCPDEAPPVDADADGIVGDADKCPEQGETVNGYQDDDGCPDELPDTDADGLKDDTDKCPTEKEDADGYQDDDGCPDLDDDGDTVKDADDKCPDKQETINGIGDDDGCPDEVPAEVAKFTGAIKGITFANGKAVVQKGSFKVLDAAAKVLAAFPEVKVEISGHTDDAGVREANLDLSAARAEAVKAYLVGKGIQAERIETRGYGPDKPVGDNKTKKGKAMNRRIEFTILTGR